MKMQPLGRGVSRGGKARIFCGPFLLSQVVVYFYIVVKYNIFDQNRLINFQIFVTFLHCIVLYWSPMSHLFASCVCEKSIPSNELCANKRR